MRYVARAGAMLAAVAAVASLTTVTPPPATADHLRQSACLPPACRYRYAGVGNGIETSVAASPDGSVYTAANQNVILVASVDPADWIYKTTDGGVNWNAIHQPGVPGTFNEGDVAVGPDGSLWAVFMDFIRIGPRLYVSRDGGATFTEGIVRGPAPVGDRPWIFANASATPGAPDMGITQASFLINSWGSNDGGNTWLHRTDAEAGFITNQDPVLGPNPFMDFGGHNGGTWTPLPGGGFLDTATRRWTPDMTTRYRLAFGSPLAELANTPWFKISSTGTVYQARLANANLHVQYRFLPPGGAWSAWRTVTTLAAQPNYCTGISATGACAGSSIEMTINTFGDLLGINTRDGNQDILLRVNDADGAAPVITRETIGTGCVARYDYPTLVFDAAGKAVFSFCATFARDGGPNFLAYER